MKKAIIAALILLAGTGCKKHPTVPTEKVNVHARIDISFSDSALFKKNFGFYMSQNSGTTNLNYTIKSSMTDKTAYWDSTFTVNSGDSIRIDLKSYYTSSWIRATLESGDNKSKLDLSAQQTKAYVKIVAK